MRVIPLREEAGPGGSAENWSRAVPHTRFAPEVVPKERSEKTVKHPQLFPGLSMAWRVGSSGCPFLADLG
jgi:hypothetical protein